MQQTETDKETFSEYIIKAAKKISQNEVEQLITPIGLKMFNEISQRIKSGENGRDGKIAEDITSKFLANLDVAKIIKKIHRIRDSFEDADVDFLNKKYIKISEEETPEKQEEAKRETRALRKKQKRDKAVFALQSGVIGGKFGGFNRATMWQINEQLQKNKATDRFLKSHMAIGQNGEAINLSNVFERKMAEFAIVCRGIQKVAEDEGMAWAKIVVTAPPNFHTNPTHGQCKWDGTMPDELCKKWTIQWARLRSALLKQDIKLVGLWTRETHADGTPHLNFLIYMDIGSEQIVKDEFYKYMSLGNTSPKAIKYEKMDQYKFNGECGFAKYAAKGFAKYSSKNLDTHNDENIDGLAEQSLASAFGWRRWGFFGIPPLSQWRVLRSQKNCPNSTPLLDSLWRAARSNNFAQFINLNGGLSATSKTRTIKTCSEISLSGKSKIVTGVIDKKAGVTLITKQVGYFELVKIKQNQVVTLKITNPREGQNLIDLNDSPKNLPDRRPQPYPSRNYDVIIS